MTLPVRSPSNPSLALTVVAVVALAAAASASGCDRGGGAAGGAGGGAGGAGGGGASTGGGSGNLIDGGNAGHEDGGLGDGGATDGAADGATEDPWVPLIGRRWQVTSYAEAWACVTIQAPEDVWISAVRPDPGPITPGATLQGAVYMMLSTSDDAPLSGGWPETGDYSCGGWAVGKQALFASGIGTGDLVLPEGTAMYIPAGRYVTLAVHAVNLDEAPLEGESGILVKRATPVDAAHQVDMIFAGLLDNHLMPIPNDGQPFVLKSTFSIPNDWTVLAVWPHMRRLGTHVSVRHERFDDGGSVLPLVDTDYDFYDEPLYPLGEHFVGTNHQIHADCTYVNETYEPKLLDDSIVQEECLVSIYKYPAGDRPFLCAPL